MRAHQPASHVGGDNDEVGITIESSRAAASTMVARWTTGPERPGDQAPPRGHVPTPPMHEVVVVLAYGDEEQRIGIAVTQLEPGRGRQDLETTQGPSARIRVDGS